VPLNEFRLYLVYVCSLLTSYSETKLSRLLVPAIPSGFLTCLSKFSSESAQKCALDKCARGKYSNLSFKNMETKSILGNVSAGSLWTSDGV
jgi:hypothetical protein